MQELAKVHELLHVKAPGEGDAGAVDSAERFAAAVQVRCTFFSSQRRAGCTNLAGTATGIAARLRRPAPQPIRMSVDASRFVLRVVFSGTVFLFLLFQVSATCTIPVDITCCKSSVAFAELLGPASALIEAL